MIIRLVVLLLVLSSTAVTAQVELKTKYIIGYEHELDRWFNMFDYSYNSVDSYIVTNDIASIEVYHNNKLVGEVLPADDFSYYFILTKEGLIDYTSVEADLKKIVKFVLKNSKNDS